MECSVAGFSSSVVYGGSSCGGVSVVPLHFLFFDSFFFIFFIVKSPVCGCWECVYIETHGCCLVLSRFCLGVVVVLSGGLFSSFFLSSSFVISSCCSIYRRNSVVRSLFGGWWNNLLFLSIHNWADEDFFFSLCSKSSITIRLHYSVILLFGCWWNNLLFLSIHNWAAEIFFNSFFVYLNFLFLVKPSITIQSY